MKTEIRIEAEMTDEQLDCLLAEIKNTAEIIGIKLKVEPSKLSQHDVIGTLPKCQSCGECSSFNIEYNCFNCGKPFAGNGL